MNLSVFWRERSRERRQHGSVFYWCRGQDDNLGDVVLRRNLHLNISRSEYTKLHLFIGRASDSFVEALDVQPTDALYRSRIRWLAALVRQSRRALIVFDPGEVRLEDSILPHSVLVPLQALASVRGGRSVKLGVAVRVSDLASGPAKVSFVLSNQLCSAVTWRDMDTPRHFSGGELGCDWAYQEMNTAAWGETSRRDMLLITVRGDRSPWEDGTVAEICRFATANELRPVVFVQVRRDNDRARQLAERLGCELIDWPDSVDHSAQEAKVRSSMQRAAAVVSDRLHALIMGLTEGAVPVAVTTAGDAKLLTHLAAVGLAENCRVADGQDSQLSAWLSDTVGARDAARAAARSAHEVATAQAAILKPGWRRDA